MTNVINELKDWHLFTDKFGDEYEMHQLWLNFLNYIKN